MYKSRLIIILSFIACTLFGQCTHDPAIVSNTAIDVGASDSDDLKISVIIILGDSRGEGLGESSNYTGQQPITIFKHETRTLDQYQLGVKYELSTAGPSGNHGLEVPLAQKVSDQNSGINTFVYKLVRSGRAACKNIVNSPDDWNVDVDTDDDLYGIFLETFPLFKQELEKISTCIDYHSVTVFLGANDASNSVCANSHYDNMEDILNGINNETGIPLNRIFIPQINGSNANQNIVKQAHLDLEANLGCKVVPTFAINFPDSVHDNTDGYESIANFIINN